MDYIHLYINARHLSLLPFPSLDPQFHFFQFDFQTSHIFLCTTIIIIIIIIIIVMIVIIISIII